MPDRIVRAGILTSERVDALGHAAEVFYRRLMSIADDYGRHDARIPILRAALYPLRLDRVGASDVAKLLHEVRDAGLVRCYTVDGGEYLEIDNFGQRTRAQRSKWPAPPAAEDGSRSSTNMRGHPLSSDSMCQQTLSDVAVVGGVVGDGNGFGKDATAAGAAAPPAQAAARNGRRIKFNQETERIDGISDQDEIRWQECHPAIVVPHEIGRAAAWLAANPANKKRNVERFLVGWFARAQDKAARVRR